MKKKGKEKRSRGDDAGGETHSKKSKASPGKGSGYKVPGTGFRFAVTVFTPGRI